MSEHTLPVLGQIRVDAVDVGVIGFGIVTLIFFALTASLSTLHLIASLIGGVVSIVMIGVYIDHARWKAEMSRGGSTHTHTDS